MNTRSILFIAAIGASTCCYAQDSHTTQQTVTVTNFANYKSGQEFCDNLISNNPKVKSCMPMCNSNSTAYINVKSKKIGDLGTVNPGTVFPVNFTQETDSFDVSITNAVTNKIIYSGPIYSMVGLICDYTSCKPWN
ncbi:hypothetical protein D5018_12210 [Parashewanella curva]|uniref:Secreted protein n=1 Tax=Parashewanella curva TaxID=2338552 RepID=A0A3L8PVK4_9GAMM|nr:hypothetical protein [Parashewanella curva]RLV59455.1 hypothetical protein D5018_12210 [Parashewanella curva]